MTKKKQKQRFSKKTILSCLKGKTIEQAIRNLEELAIQGYGDCKIEIESKLTSGPGYFRSITSKTKCNILIPIEEDICQ